MSLLSALKNIGKTLEHFGEWELKALPTEAAILAEVDPPLAPVVAMVENAVAGLLSVGKQPTENDLKQITQAATVLQAVQHVINSNTPQGKN